MQICICALSTRAPISWLFIKNPISNSSLLDKHQRTNFYSMPSSYLINLPMIFSIWDWATRPNSNNSIGCAPWLFCTKIDGKLNISQLTFLNRLVIALLVVEQYLGRVWHTRQEQKDARHRGDRWQRDENGPEFWGAFESIHSKEEDSSNKKLIVFKFFLQNSSFGSEPSRLPFWFTVYPKKSFNQD